MRRRQMGILLTLVGAVAAAGGFGLYHFTPPVEPIPATTTADLRKADRPEALPHPYISFDCPKVIETKVILSGRGYKGRPWKAFYYLLPVEDRFIVASSDKPVGRGRIQGQVVRWDMPVNVSALQKVHATLPAYRDKLLPVQLNVGDYVDPPQIHGAPLLYVLAGIAGCVALLVGLFKLATAFPEPEPIPAPVEPQWSFMPPRR
jgi:hypothetical protein